MDEADGNNLGGSTGDDRSCMHRPDSGLAADWIDWAGAADRGRVCRSRQLGDLGGGAHYGYALLSIVLLANLIAMIAQALCVRLAIATGRGLAELCREAFSPPVVMLLWLLAEVAMVATDLAELVGGAVALKLLFRIGLLAGVLLVGAGTFVVLLLGGSDWRCAAWFSL